MTLEFLKNCEENENIYWEETFGSRIMHYLTQDFSWNAGDGQYDLTLHSDVFPQNWICPLMQSVRYEKDGGEVMVATFCIPQISMILHCKCKQGSPTGVSTLISKEQQELN